MLYVFDHSKKVAQVFKKYNYKTKYNLLKYKVKLVSLLLHVYYMSL